MHNAHRFRIVLRSRVNLATAQLQIPHHFWAILLLFSRLFGDVWAFPMAFYSTIRLSIALGVRDNTLSA